jgi:hypothetical protein
MSTTMQTNDFEGDPTGMAPRPMLFGYQRVRLMTPAGEVIKARKAIAAHADRIGYSLGEIFVDADENRPYGALVMLVVAARRRGVQVIVVPSLDHFGHTPAAQSVIRRRLAEEAGLRVVVLDSGRPGAARAR